MSVRTLRVLYQYKISDSLPRGTRTQRNELKIQHGNMGGKSYKEEVFCHENSQTATVKGCRISILRDMQNLTANHHQQPYPFGTGGWIR